MQMKTEMKLKFVEITLLLNHSIVYLCSFQLEVKINPSTGVIIK